MNAEFLRTGLIVPCRDEARVLERKLANLARLQRPPCAGELELVIVDDGSRDDSAALARACFERAPMWRGWHPQVIANHHAPGKVGAIHSALEALRGKVDLLVLSDADVVVDDQALLETERAFREEPELGLACAGQVFVRELAADGSIAGPDGAALVPAAGSYDRWTAAVRRFESRRGTLFSVHGQWLAWRAGLGLAPAPGIAADDLDLMLQARALGQRVRLLERARFYEVKTPPGLERERQALRRARAYVQVVRRARALKASAFDRWQWRCYRYLPERAPELTGVLVVACMLALAGIARAIGLGAWPAALLGLLLPLLSLWLVPALRRLLRLEWIILRARRAEARGTLSDRWEMSR